MLTKLGHTNVSCVGGTRGAYNGVGYFTEETVEAKVHAAAFRAWAETVLPDRELLPIPALRALGFTLTLTDDGVTVTSPHGWSFPLPFTSPRSRGHILHFAVNAEYMAAVEASGSTSF